MSLLLVRHGETKSNIPPLRIQGHLDVPLNAKGRAQAAELVTQVAGEGVEQIYTSPLMRAAETANIIGAGLELTPINEPRLMESNRGRWQGTTWECVRQQEPDLYQEWISAKSDFRFPGGESLQEHMDRVVAALASISQESKRALVVCHGGTIRMALCSSHGYGVEAFHRWGVSNAALVRL